MNLLVGWGFNGPTFTPRDVPSETARVGEPMWGKAALLRDLEMRLGLPPVSEASSVRVPRWAARIRGVGDAKAFYATSFAVDEIGTAATLLAWRDALIEAGWDGAPVAGGGDRLDAIARIERHASDEPMPLGRADRLVRVERALATHAGAIYASIALVEARALWPRRWQRIFDALESLGTRFERFEVDLPGAAPTTDLGVLQALLRAEASRAEARGDVARRAASPAAVRGDGSLLLVRGDTNGELAELTAAVLASHARRADTVVVRARDPESLDAALAAQGLATQGHDGASAWRPAMQVLPLALELAFEPRDPYRVLELLTLPVGPFRGVLGSRLARAVSRQPGIGGQEWQRQKDEAAERLHARILRDAIANGASDRDAAAAADAHVASRLARVAEWLETPGAHADGAPRDALLVVAERVRAWLQNQMAGDARDAYAPAYAQAKAFAEALQNDARASFTREEARYVLDRLARAAHAEQLTPEEAGRVAHVSHPSALLALRHAYANFLKGRTRPCASVRAHVRQTLSRMGPRGDALVVRPVILWTGLSVPPNPRAMRRIPAITLSAHRVMSWESSRAARVLAPNDPGERREHRARSSKSTSADLTRTRKRSSILRSESVNLVRRDRQSR